MLTLLGKWGLQEKTMTRAQAIKCFVAACAVIAVLVIFPDLRQNVGDNPAEWVAGWGTLALINAVLAQIKNHMRKRQDLGGLAWFLISLVIGPIATFIIAVFKEPNDS